MTALLRIFCSAQPYLSHARAAADYVRILRDLCQVVEDPCQAQVALLHYEPPHLAALLREVPALRHLYRIGYCVWEADPLPKRFLPGIAQMHEIWTASWYTWELFAQQHPRVVWVPHVVDCPATAAPAAVADLATQLQAAAGAATGPTFLTIGEGRNRRKNLGGLLRAFASVAERLPGARLLVKTSATPPRPLDHPCIRVRGPLVFIEGMLSDAYLRALYDLADVYVSAHFSEGWGLTLTDAMAARCPVVATGFSGNLDFMTRDNAFWVETDRALVRPRDAFGDFGTHMFWGAPRRESLTSQLQAAANACGDGSVRARVERAAADVQSFDRAHLTEHLRDQIARLSAQLLRTPTR